MTYLCDTSIVLRINDPDSAAHTDTLNALEKLRREGERLVLVPQILVEFWVVATRPKDVNGLGFTTEQAEKELENLQNIFTVLPENERMFEEWKTLVVKHKVNGKPAHDTRIVAALKVHKITHLLTLNPKDFKRYTGISAVTPQEVLGQTN